MANVFEKLNLTKYMTINSLSRIGWAKLKNVPSGKFIFSKVVGQFIPYTGSISPLVEKIENGFATVTLRDTRAVRNHLDCLHAIALANVGEFATGLSVISQLESGAKSILVKIEVEYLKKARGDVRAETFFQMPENLSQDTEFRVSANIVNLQNEIVCVVHATWRIRPAKKE